MVGCDNAGQNILWYCRGKDNSLHSLASIRLQCPHPRHKIEYIRLQSGLSDESMPSGEFYSSSHRHTE